MPGATHLDAMRTTLTIDDGLLRQLRQKVLDSGKPFKQVVNETLRAGLERPAPLRVPTFSTGPLPPGVDLTKANQLRLHCEDEALLETVLQGMLRS
jgi:hypothetical protein